MKYIDTHCHLDFPDYDKDRKEVFERMKLYNISAITIGTDLESSKRAVQMAETNENIWACIGIHPQECQGLSLTLFDEKEFEILVKNSKVVAIGECGLDYHAPRSLSGAKSEVGLSEEEKNCQKKLFEQQIVFAIKHNKPLMLHCRPARRGFAVGERGGDAYGDVLDILESYKKEVGEKLRGNTHFFAGSIEQAKKFLDIGFTMSFTGVITFTRDYDEVIKFLPTSSIMSETDAPFVAPIPHRNERNEPVFVIEVVKKIAEIRGQDIESMEKALVENASRIFGIVL